MGSAWISFEARMANSSLDSAGRVTAKQKAGAVFDPIPRRLNLIMIRSYVAHMSLGKFVWTGRFQTWIGSATGSLPVLETIPKKPSLDG
jgi:hypothetical protein